MHSVEIKVSDKDLIADCDALIAGMEKAMFTPGPWRYSDVIGGCWVYASDGRQVLAYTYSPDKENRANARLVAAAPELLEALKPFVAATLTHNGHVIGLMREDFERARAAIAKAICE